MAQSLWAVLMLVLSLLMQAGVDLSAVPAAPQPLATAAATPEPAFDPMLYEQGKQVYLSQYCGVCHTLAAADTHGMFGPAHDGIGANATQRIADPRYGGQATTAAEYIRESIVAPSTFVAAGAGLGRQAMPTYAHLPPADIDALVYFLSQQR